jgi:hypothetical protein
LAAESGGIKMRKKPLINPLRVGVVSVAILTVLVVNGCIFGSRDGEDGEPPPGLDTPARVVEAIEVAYNIRDIEDYKVCLSPNFTFYFDRSDVGEDVGGYTIPDSWGYDDEVDAVKNMFGELYSIELSLDSSNIVDPGSSDTVFYADNVQIKLLVMIDSVNGYLAQGFVDFNFESYTSPKGKLWRVKDWSDYTAPD